MLPVNWALTDTARVVAKSGSQAAPAGADTRTSQGAVLSLLAEEWGASPRHLGTMAAA